MQDTNRFFAIGDIHGCVLSLESLISTLSASYSDFENRSFVFLGDYTDRGPKSKEVVDFLLNFSEKYDCIFIRGNHDLMLLDAVQKDDWKLWIANGGELTISNYGMNSDKLNIPDEHLAFFQSTQIFYETEHYVFVHGGLHPDLTIRENLDHEKYYDDFLWTRNHINAGWNNWDKTVVFGHTPVHSPIHKNNMIGIDTGCVYVKRGYGNLTAVALPEEEFHQQKCLDIN